MKKTNVHLEQILTQTLTFSGFVLALIQLLMNRSLWLDEAYLALSIVHKSPVELLQPLYYCQVAPILFLQMEKLCSSIFANSEFGLRLFPFVNYCLSLILFHKIVHLLFKNIYARLFALSLFVFCGPLIYYASEVKQYMSDVLVFLAFYYFTLKNYEDEKNRYRTLTAVGFISIFLSNIAPIALFTEGSYFLFIYIRNKKQIPKQLIITFFIWIITYFAYYFLFVYHHPAQSMMVNYWSSNNGFMPINPFEKKLYSSLFERTRTFFTLFFGLSGRIVLPILFLIGGIFLIKSKQISLVILLLLPITLHWFLSALRLYPFDARLILYACPLLILVTTFGFDCLITTLFSNYSLKRPLVFAAVVPLLMAYSFYDLKFYTKGEELKKCLSYLEQNKGMNASIYVSYHASPPFLYYQNVFFPTLNSPLIIGQFAETDAVFDTDLKKLKGKTWFLFSDWLPMDKRHAAYLLNYYKSKDVVLKKGFKAVGYTVYLLDIPENDR